MPILQFKSQSDKFRLHRSIWDISVRIRELEEVLAELGVWSSSQIDQHARRLRGLGLLPIGGRGVNAPKATPKDAATLIVSLAATTAPSGAHRGPQVIGKLKLRKEAGRENVPFLARRFLDAFTEVLSDVALAKITAVQISQIRESALIVVVGDGPILPGGIDFAPHHYGEPINHPSIDIEVTFRGDFLGLIAELIPKERRRGPRVPQDVPQNGSGA